LWRVTAIDAPGEIAEEMVRLADEGGIGPGPAGIAHLTRAVVAIQRADRSTFEADLARSRVLAEQSRLPGLLSQVGWAEAVWLLASGRYDEAGERARETYRLYRRTRGWEADDILAAFEVTIAHDRGETTVRNDDHVAALLSGRFSPAARELLAWMHAERGDLDRARELVGPAGSVPDAPPDWLWFGRTTAAAHVRAALGDRTACAVLREQLAPFAGRLDLAAGPFLGGTDLALAALADALDDRDAALRHAAAAVTLLEHIGTRPALARALTLRGRLLLGSADDDAGAAATAVLDRARAVAEELGLVPVLAALDGIQARSKVTHA
jgi:hypothetical protein